MPYMAVGSRQILFSDSPAPARTGSEVREVSNLTDNQDRPTTEVRESKPESVPPPEPEKGSRIDVQA